MSNATARRIGARVKQLRDAKRLSQAELARRAFVSRSYITHIETGRNIPSYEVLGHIADALGVGRAQLDPDSEIPQTPESRAALVIERVAAALVVIPIEYYGAVPADARRWAVAGERGEMRSVLPEWIGARSAEDHFVITASGDCLRTSHQISAGNLVLLRWCRGQEPANGSIAVVRIGDELTLKIWHRDRSTITLTDGDGQVARTLSTADDVEAIGLYVIHWPEKTAI